MGAEAGVSVGAGDGDGDGERTETVENVAVAICFSNWWYGSAVVVQRDDAASRNSRKLVSCECVN